MVHFTPTWPVVPEYGGIPPKYFAVRTTLVLEATLDAGGGVRVSGRRLVASAVLPAASVTIKVTR